MKIKCLHFSYSQQNSHLQILLVKLSLKRKLFQWKFYIADIEQFILKADFLSYFGYLLDIKNVSLILS